MQEIAEISVYADQKSQERASLERDVALLEADIKKTQLQIQARNINIKQIGGEITNGARQSSHSPRSTLAKRGSLAKLIRTTNQLDDNSVIELALSSNISDFFEDLDAFDSINVALQDSFRDIEVTKADPKPKKSRSKSRIPKRSTSNISRKSNDKRSKPARQRRSMS